MHLIIGLGNIGKEYEKTRHNAGFMVADAIVSEYGFSKPKVKFHSQIFEGNIAGEKVVILKPQTYMNKSGLAVGEAVKFHKVPLENIIVIHDEIDLELGKIRVKTGGGHGGHNGLRDIDARIGKDYKRVRIGVGHPGDKDEVSNHVLSKFSKGEQEQIEHIIASISSDINLLMKGDDDLFMTRVN